MESCAADSAALTRASRSVTTVRWHSAWASASCSSSWHASRGNARVGRPGARANSTESNAAIRCSNTAAARMPAAARDQAGGRRSAVAGRESDGPAAIGTAEPEDSVATCPAVVAAVADAGRPKTCRRTASAHGSGSVRAESQRAAGSAMPAASRRRSAVMPGTDSRPMPRAASAACSTARCRRARVVAAAEALGSGESGSGA